LDFRQRWTSRHHCRRYYLEVTR